MQGCWLVGWRLLGGAARRVVSLTPMTSQQCAGEAARDTAHKFSQVSRRQVLSAAALALQLQRGAATGACTRTAACLAATQVG